MSVIFDNNPSKIPFSIFQFHIWICCSFISRGHCYQFWLHEFLVFYWVVWSKCEFYFCQGSLGRDRDGNRMARLYEWCCTSRTESCQWSSCKIRQHTASTIWLKLLGQLVNLGYVFFGTHADYTLAYETDIGPEQKEYRGPQSDRVIAMKKYTENPMLYPLTTTTTTTIIIIMQFI